MPDNFMGDCPVDIKFDGNMPVFCQEFRFQLVNFLKVYFFPFLFVVLFCVPEWRHFPQIDNNLWQFLEDKINFFFCIIVA